MIEIKDYRHYLDCIKKWESYSAEEQEPLRKWYREYYHRNQEKEQDRYKLYYSLNKSKRRKMN